MVAANDWWQTFFSGVVVDSWLAATTEEQTQAEADFFQKMLQVPAPAKLLDVPCGGGRHSLAMARRGYQMTGVDISADFLKAARSKASSGGLPVAWEQRDMRDLPWPASFDGAFCTGNSFGYYDEAGNKDFLQAVGRALKPGACFVLDTSYLTEGFLSKMQERAWYEHEGMLMLADRRYEPASGRLHVEYTYIRDGQKDKRVMSARLFSYREVVRLMEEAGFTDLQGFGSLAQEPFKFGSHQLLMVGTKKG